MLCLVVLRRRFFAIGTRLGLRSSPKAQIPTDLILSFTKMCPCPAGSLSARIVHSHAGYHSVRVSVRSTTGLWASSRGCREPRLAAAVGAYKRKRKRALLTEWDRLFWVTLSQVWSGWRHALVFLQPDTVVCWQRERFRRFWTLLSRPNGPRRGRPAVARSADSFGRWRSPIRCGERREFMRS